MALWEDHVYWTDWTHREVASGNKRNGKHVQTMLKAAHKMQYFGLDLYNPAMMEDVRELMTKWLIVYRFAVCSFNS